MEDYIKKIDDSIKDNYFNRYLFHEIGVHVTVLGKDVIIYSDRTDFSNCKDIYNIVNYFIDKNYSSFEIKLDAFSSDKGLLSFDYSYIHKIKKALDKANKKSDIRIGYDDCCVANYDDYFALIECIKWYRSLISSYNLSPVEKLTYSYDIMKTMHYKKSGDTIDDNRDDNRLHLVVKTGNIVCLGYNRFMKEITAGYDGIKFIEFTTYCYDAFESEVHSRGAVKLDDDSYDIHGIYFLDVTWDSVHEDFYDTYGENYDALSGYRYFLVPIYKYGKYFKRNSYPRIFRGKHNYAQEKYLTKKKLDEITLDHKQNNRPVNKKLINEDFRPLIGKDMTMSELYKYLNCDRPSRNTFINILYRVRFCEGYTFDDLNGTLVFGIDTDNKDDGFIFETEKENEIKLVL